MIDLRLNRLLWVSCLESLSHLFLNSFGKMTAAAVTGPAKQPRPASSVPHSYFLFVRLCLSTLN